MASWFRKRVQPHMIRPLIYKIFTRGILSLFFLQLWRFFVPGAASAGYANQCAVFCAVFALFSVLAWMRMDGLKIPQVKLPRGQRKDPPFLTGDMADHLDEKPILFDDLEKEEQDVCVLLADLFLALVYLICAIVL